MRILKSIELYTLSRYMAWYVNYISIKLIYFGTPEESLKRWHLCSRTSTILLEICMIAIFIKILRTERTGFRYEPQKVISANTSICWSWFVYYHKQACVALG